MNYSAAIHIPFSDKVTAYAQYRPGYPAEAIDQLLSPFQSKRYYNLNVADIGAGTGISSVHLAERGLHVLAAEPNRAMLQTAEIHPRITYRSLMAEKLRLADRSMELITAFQAFHWFDFKMSLSEFRRVLKPEGYLALVWNYWDTNHTFTARCAHAMEDTAIKKPDRLYHINGYSSHLSKKLRLKMLWDFRYLPYFKKVQKYTYQYSEQVSMQELIGAARSQTYLDHNGMVWDDLVEQLKVIFASSSDRKLRYTTTLFMAQPRY